MRIISVSRRTDIPAFYTPWFMNRVREGFVLVPNPFNARQVSRVDLSPDNTACLVFWTRDPRPLLPHLRELEERGYRFYFHVTVTGLPPVFEPAAPPVESAVAAVHDLSRAVGSDWVVWRFDPILLSELTPRDRILETFDSLAHRLSGCVSTATISFARDYRRVTTRMKRVAPHAVPRYLGVNALEEKGEIASALSKAGSSRGIIVQACAEPEDLSPYGVTAASCIDPHLINRVFGLSLPHQKDKGQRSACRCAPSTDIGIYGTCPHNCVYCYASCSDALGRGRHHDPYAPSLLVQPPIRQS